ncbi:RebB family R body protein [Pseudoalteromonas sp. XMcav2-N-2]|uniref:RebB family R body protein n=1 Tax=unclassified Pseudoalteromonas TaxID=194690 RepID=UPI0020978BA5|nr:RebB family R body protein [Pseudoalteromonas sp. XMcav2-N]
MLNTLEANGFSLAVASTTMGHSISLLMENAVQNEARSQLTSSTAVAQCCALMVAAGAAAIKSG